MRRRASRTFLPELSSSLNFCGSSSTINHSLQNASTIDLWLLSLTRKRLLQPSWCSWSLVKYSLCYLIILIYHQLVNRLPWISTVPDTDQSANLRFKALMIHETAFPMPQDDDLHLSRVCPSRAWMTLLSFSALLDLSRACWKQPPRRATWVSILSAYHLRTHAMTLHAQGGDIEERDGMLGIDITTRMTVTQEIFINRYPLIEIRLLKFFHYTVVRRSLIPNLTPRPLRVSAHIL